MLTAANSNVPAKTFPADPEDHLPRGLTSDEASALLAKFGPNAMAPLLRESQSSVEYQ
jgi:cation transport ATPase-like protein